MDEALTVGWMEGIDKETEKVQRDLGTPLIVLPFFVVVLFLGLLSFLLNLFL